MMRKLPFHVLAAPLAVLFAAGCSRATQTSRAWTEPSFEANSLRKLMVIGVGTTPTIRRSLEDQFVAALQAEGIVAEPSYRLVGDGILDSARTSAEMRRTESDGVLVARIVDQKTVRAYYPATAMYPTASYAWGSAPYRHGWFGYYGWYGYYGLGYAYATTRGYTVDNKSVSYEATLFRVADGQLAWSALSQEWRWKSGTSGGDDDQFVRQLVSALLESRVVTRGHS